MKKTLFIFVLFFFIFEVDGNVGANYSLDKDVVSYHYTVKKGDSLAGIARRFHLTVQELRSWNMLLLAKNRKCSGRNDTLYPEDRIMLYFQSRISRASWYGPGFWGRKTSSGHIYHPGDAVIVAHKSLPFGTCIFFVNLANGRTGVGVVKDRGPYIEGREFDFSDGLAKRLRMVRAGVVRVLAVPGKCEDFEDEESPEKAG